MVRVYWKPANNDKPLDFQKKSGTVGATTRDRFSGQSMRASAAGEGLQNAQPVDGGQDTGTNWVPWVVGGGIAVAGIATAIAIAMTRKS